MTSYRDYNLCQFYLQLAHALPSQDQILSGAVDVERPKKGQKPLAWSKKIPAPVIDPKESGAGEKRGRIGKRGTCGMGIAWVLILLTGAGTY